MLGQGAQTRDWNRLGRPADRVAGRVEILWPVGQAGWNTGQIHFSCNHNTSKHQPKYTYIFYHKSNFL